MNELKVKPVATLKLDKYYYILVLHYFPREGRNRIEQMINRLVRSFKSGATGRRDRPIHRKLGRCYFSEKGLRLFLSGSHTQTDPFYARIFNTKFTHYESQLVWVFFF